MQLKNGKIRKFPAAKKDWTELGAEAFVYEVLEQKEANEVTDKRWKLEQMVKLWMEKVAALWGQRI
ncbi:hypothetical protein GCM10020331_008220 [Ectobacillus funiculus]